MLKGIFLSVKLYAPGRRPARRDDALGADARTSLGLGEALVQAEDDFVYKVLDVAVLGPSHEHHPVVCEAFGCGLLPQLSAVAQFQFHLYRALHTHTIKFKLKQKLFQMS